jgi:hypothetical protein
VIILGAIAFFVGTFVTLALWICLEAIEKIKN